MEATKKSKQFARIKAEEQINSLHKVLAAQNNANKTKRNETKRSSGACLLMQTGPKPHTRTLTHTHAHTSWPTQTPAHTHTHT